MRVFFLAVGILFSAQLIGQNARLAQQYYSDGEYEKAAILYEKLYEKNKANDYYFSSMAEEASHSRRAELWFKACLV